MLASSDMMACYFSGDPGRPGDGRRRLALGRIFSSIPLVRGSRRGPRRRQTHHIEGLSIVGARLPLGSVYGFWGLGLNLSLESADVRGTPLCPSNLGGSGPDWYCRRHKPVQSLSRIGFIHAHSNPAVPGQRSGSPGIRRLFAYRWG